MAALAAIVCAFGDKGCSNAKKGGISSKFLSKSKGGHGADEMVDWPKALPFCQLSDKVIFVVINGTLRFSAIVFVARRANLQGLP